MRDLNALCKHKWEVKTLDASTVNSLISSTVTMCSLCGYIGQSVPITNPTWTTEKPTEPGWYWFRFGPIDKPVMFWISVRAGIQGGELWVRHALPLISEKPVSDYDGQWAGPLEPPE